jgi:hypothetical protein
MKKQVILSTALTLMSVVLSFGAVTAPVTGPDIRGCFPAQGCGSGNSSRPPLTIANRTPQTGAGHGRPPVGPFSKPAVLDAPVVLDARDFAHWFGCKPQPYCRYMAK